MSTYQHILVGVDLSEDSQLVMQKAAGIAKAFGADISVAHVLEPLAFAYGGDMPIDLTEAQTSMEEQATKRLAKLGQEYHIDKHHQIVALGQPSSVLHDIAEERKADLIIVGSHGKHGFALLFGSTAKGVVTGADCDVLAVRV